MRSITQTMIVQMKNSFARKMFQFTMLVQPIIYTCITYFLFKQTKETNFGAYVVLGSGLLSFWSCIVFSSAGDIDRERWMNTLPYLFASPTNFTKIVIAKILGNTCIGLFPFVISYIVATCIFQSPFTIAHPLLFLAIVPLVILAFVAVAFIFAAVFTISKKGGTLMNCLEYPIFILCGMAFPISILPDWIQPISKLLLPTYAVNILRESVLSIPDMQQFIYKIVILVGCSLVYFIVGYILFIQMDKHVRNHASLEVF